MNENKKTAVTLILAGGERRQDAGFPRTLSNPGNVAGNVAADFVVGYILNAKNIRPADLDAGNKTKMKNKNEIKSLPEVRAAIFQSLELIDSILTWQDLSDSRRQFLTDASNHLELASKATLSAILLVASGKAGVLS